MGDYCPECAHSMEENDDGDDECVSCGYVDKEWW